MATMKRREIITWMTLLMYLAGSVEEVQSLRSGLQITALAGTVPSTKYKVLSRPNEVRNFFVIYLQTHLLKHRIYVENIGNAGEFGQKGAEANGDNDNN